VCTLLLPPGLEGILKTEQIYPIFPDSFPSFSNQSFLHLTGQSSTEDGFAGKTTF
jgi:hypothetical protein